MALRFLVQLSTSPGSPGPARCLPQLRPMRMASGTKPVFTGSTYLIAPAEAGFAFSPASRTVTDGAAGLDFTGLRQAGASGRVVSSTNGSGLAGVTLTFMLVSGSTVVPAPVQTDAQGNYSQIGFVADTTYLVVPSKASFTFTPASLTFTGTSTNLNFAGAAVPFNVSGRITDGARAGSGGVTLTFTRLTGTGGAPSSVQTDSLGNYSQSNFETGSSYLVSPSKAGYTFTPVSRNFSHAAELHHLGAAAYRIRQNRRRRRQRPPAAYADIRAGQRLRNTARPGTNRFAGQLATVRISGRPVLDSDAE